MKEIRISGYATIEMPDRWELMYSIANIVINIVLTMHGDRWVLELLR